MASRTKKKVIKKSNLGKILNRKGLSQYRLAKLLKRPQSQINQWVNANNPDAQGCAELMSLLNCSIYDLLHTFEQSNSSVKEDLEEELDIILEGLDE